MKYKIRKINFEDAKGIAKVHIKSWRETYKGIVDDEYLKNLTLKSRTKKWEEIFEKPKDDNWIFVVEDEDGNIVGFISGGSAREHVAQFKGELFAIYILKKHHGCNLGFRLTKKLCSIMESKTCMSVYCKTTTPKISIQSMVPKD